jgi:hypothetical protein
MQFGEFFSSLHERAVAGKKDWNRFPTPGGMITSSHLSMLMNKLAGNERLNHIYVHNLSKPYAMPTMYHTLCLPCTTLCICTSCKAEDRANVLQVPAPIPLHWSLPCLVIASLVINIVMDYNTSLYKQTIVSLSLTRLHHPRLHTFYCSACIKASRFMDTARKPNKY